MLQRSSSEIIAEIIDCDGIAILVIVHQDHVRIAPTGCFDHVFIQADWKAFYIHFIPGVHLTLIDPTNLACHSILYKIGILLIIWIEAVTNPVNSNQQDFLPVESLVDEVDHFFLGYHLITIVIKPCKLLVKCICCHLLV